MKSAPAASRCSARRAAGRRCRRKYQIDTVSYVNTLLHTFNNTHLLGVHRRRELVAPVHQRRSMRRHWTSTTVSQVLPGFKQFFPNANPLNLLPQASFTGGVRGTIAVVRIRAALRPFFGYNTLFNFSRQPDQAEGRAQHEDRPLRRAHDAAGAAVVLVQRHA